MFAEETKEKIFEAVMAETQQAVDSNGATYSSSHEAYAVLKEEIEETREYTEKFRGLMHILWKSVRGLPVTEVKHFSLMRHVICIKENAIKTAMEATQVAAVCNKIINSIEEKKL